MDQNEHLPIYGPGPAYVGIIAAITAAAVLARNLPLLAAGRIAALQPIMLVVGIVFVLAGIALWIYAVPISKIDDGIKENRLVTSGAYALVRNPIYSAFMLICDGVLLIAGNAWLLVLPFIFWTFLTVLMKHTEEKWLHGLYGKEYEAYCERVNRCWPWIPRKGSNAIR